MKREVKIKLKITHCILIVTCCFILAAAQGTVKEAAAAEDNYNIPYLEAGEITLAAGFPEYNLTDMLNGRLISASSDNPQTAFITEDGVITPKQPGEAVITLKAAWDSGFYGEEEQVTELTCKVHVVKFGFAQESITIILNKEYSSQVVLNGMNALNVNLQECYVKNEEVAYAYPEPDYEGGSITVYAEAPGSTSLMVRANGSLWECKVNVVYYELNKPTLLLMRGRTGTLKVKGFKGKVKWASDNKKIAAVSSKGVVKAKSKGTAAITASLDGDIVIRCYVSVAGDKAIKAVKKAKSVLGAVYSQAKRMEKGYYDCSSLTWRSYRPYGVTFGHSGWAPTAAEQARWCVSNHKVIAKKAIKAKSFKLMPGDLIFYTRGDNGRYKNIYHVAMFAGYEDYEYAEYGPGVSGVLVEADGYAVSLRPYIENYGDGKEIVMIARPVS